MVKVGDAWRWVKGKIPPVTALFTLLLILSYLRRTDLDLLLKPQTSLAWRALLSAFHHKTGLHLFINMMWTLHSGAHFEKLHGSWYFLGITTLMIFLSQGLTLLIYLPLAFFTNQWFHVSMPSPQLNTYTLGFSGVLFALHFLLVTSSPYHSIEEGLLLSSHHHGLLIEGLFMLATLQSLILPDSHFFNNLCGIVAGFVYISIPPMLNFLMECVMIIHFKVLHPMYHTMNKIFQKLCIESKGHYHNLFLEYSQGSRTLHTNHRNNYGHRAPNREEEEDEDNEEDEEAMDPTLQWECKRCLNKNGVFLSFCLFCEQPRTLYY